MRQIRGRDQPNDQADPDERQALADHEPEDERRSAPSAMRMPISRVRREIENASTP